MLIMDGLVTILRKRIQLTWKWPKSTHEKMKQVLYSWINITFLFLQPIVILNLIWTKEKKEPSKELVDLLENMQEMVKNMNLIMRGMAKNRYFEQYRNPYGPKPYWNPKKTPMNEDNKRTHVGQTSPNSKNINWTE